MDDREDLPGVLITYRDYLITQAIYPFCKKHISQLLNQAQKQYVENEGTVPKTELLQKLLPTVTEYRARKILVPDVSDFKKIVNEKLKQKFSSKSDRLIEIFLSKCLINVCRTLNKNINYFNENCSSAMRKANELKVIGLIKQSINDVINSHLDNSDLKSTMSAVTTFGRNNEPPPPPRRHVVHDAEAEEEERKLPPFQNILSDMSSTSSSSSSSSSSSASSSSPEEAEAPVMEIEEGIQIGGTVKHVSEEHNHIDIDGLKDYISQQISGLREYINEAVVNKLNVQIVPPKEQEVVIEPPQTSQEVAEEEEGGGREIVTTKPKRGGKRGGGKGRPKKNPQVAGGILKKVVVIEEKEEEEEKRKEKEEDEEEVISNNSNNKKSTTVTFELEEEEDKNPPPLNNEEDPEIVSISEGGSSNFSLFEGGFFESPPDQKS